MPFFGTRHERNMQVVDASVVPAGSAGQRPVPVIRYLQMRKGRRIPLGRITRDGGLHWVWGGVTRVLRAWIRYRLGSHRALSPPTVYPNRIPHQPPVEASVHGARCAGRAGALQSGGRKYQWRVAFLPFKESGPLACKRHIYHHHKRRTRRIRRSRAAAHRPMDTQINRRSRYIDRRSR